MSELVRPYNVTTVDGREISKIYPVRILNGWELKPFSIIHSPFERVLLLDADVVPVMDPTFLFSSTEFRKTGAIFWPDYGRLERDREIWDACDVAYCDEPEFESGQIVVDKRRCWKAMQVTMHLNEYSDFYYNLIHGDKETFHMGFRCTDTPYAMPWRPIESLEATMCQHDFTGARLFQHRNLAKWDLYGDNLRIDGFMLEDECITYVEELLRRWDGYSESIPRYSKQGRTRRELAAAAVLINYVHRYVRIGYDERPITFLADGRIGEGRQRCEAFWDVIEEGPSLSLQISSASTATCILRYENEVWSGEWLDHEQMPIVLESTSERSDTLNQDSEPDSIFPEQTDTQLQPFHPAPRA